MNSAQITIAHSPAPAIALPGGKNSQQARKSAEVSSSTAG